jgi:hypothetical protein
MAEKRTIELEVKESGFKSLKAQLREAQADVAALSDKFGATSKEAAAAAKAAGILKDKIADAKDLTDAFNPDAKFNSLSRSIGGVLNGFQAYEGAMGLIGVESEDLQKTLLKVQSAMALSQGIQGALEAKDSFVQLGAVVKTAFTGMTAASKAFMVGGIGLLIGAIGLLVANWDSVTQALGATTDEQKKLKEETTKFNKAAQESAEYVAKESAEFVTLIHQLKQTNENSKERKGLITQINKQYGTTLKNLSDETAFQAALNLALEDYIKFQKDSFRLAKNKELIQKAIEKEDVVTTKLNKEKRKLAEIEERLNEELNKRISIDAYLKNGAEGAARAENLQKLRVANVTAEFEKQQAAVRVLSVEYNNIEERIRNYSKTASSLESDIEGKYIPATEKQTTAIDANTTALDENAKKYEEVGSLKLLNQEEHIKTSLDLLKEQVDAEALINRDARDKELAAEKQAALDKAAAKTAAFQAGVDLTIKYLQTFADVTNSINSLMNANDSERLKNENITAKESEKIKRRMFDRDKKLRIVQTIIDTASNVVQSVRNGGGIPTGIPFGIAAGAMGALQVAAISKTTFDSGGSGGGGGGNIGGGAPTAPNFNIVGNSGINQLAELGGQPIQAYVVSGEVTSAQALDRNRIQNASF